MKQLLTTWQILLITIKDGDYISSVRKKIDFTDLTTRENVEFLIKKGFLIKTKKGRYAILTLTIKGRIVQTALLVINEQLGDNSW